MYNAFISYSHGADSLFAPALQNALQKFAKPWYKKRNLEIFRDESNLSASPLLWKNITAALDASQYLILLASPASEQSKWVNKEVEYWLQTKSIDTILVALTDGNMDWDNDNNCFLHPDKNALPPVLDVAFNSEPFYIDMRQVKTVKDLSPANPIFKKEILKLAAKLHGLQPNDMASEEVSTHRKMIWVRNIAFTLLITLLVAALIASNIANQQKHKAIDLAGKNTKLAKAFESVYFYADRFAVSSGMTAFYYVDKNGDKVEKLGEWQEAEQFNYTGYARVRKYKTYSFFGTHDGEDEDDGFLSKNMSDYILDTTGNAFPSAYHPKDMDSSTTALDLADGHFDVLPSSVFSNPRLEILLLPNNKLKDLPQNIGKLKKLIKLDLSENRLRVLPNAIGNLESLEVLDLRGNNLTSLPQSIGTLQHLKELHVFMSLNSLGSLGSAVMHNMDFSPQYLEVIPKELGALKNLTSLDLTISHKAQIPGEIGALKNLETLILFADSAAKIPTSIWNLNALKYIMLDEIQIDSIPADIAHLQQLKACAILNANISFLPDELFRLSGLSSLILTHNRLTKIPDQIGNLKNVMMLDFSENRITEIPSSIANLQQLAFLNVMSNQLTTLPREIINLKSLISFSIDNNKFSIFPKEIFRLDSLTTLSLGGNGLAVLPVEIGNMEKLTSLKLQNNKLTELPSSIARLINLKSLDISNNNLETLPEVLFKLKNLKELKLDHNHIPPYEITNLKQQLSECRISY